MKDTLTGETWQFHVSADGTITRGRKYQLPDDGGDSWRWYWDGDQMVAFIDGYCRDGTYAVTQNEDTDRALVVYRVEKAGERGAEGGLKRLAVRITGQADADFICVGLDRGTDLYALSWDGDTDHEWRDEIEAVYNGDVWRIETERFEPRYTEYGDEACWVPDDDICGEWYGEDKAEAAFVREFPLDEFPAELLIESE
jgi:hypothetical protein